MKVFTHLRCALLIAALFLLTEPAMMAANSAGPKPQWVRKGESSLNAQRSNETYYFKVVRTSGQDLQSLRNNRINTLSSYIGQQHNLTGKAKTEMVNCQQGQDVKSGLTFRMVFEDETSVQVFDAVLVDEHWEREAGEYQYYALFAVSDRTDGATFDRFEVTRSYGAAPAFMSIIPGVGQLYKGQKLKGSLMLGGVALGAGAIIFCENERASYVAKMQEQPKYAQTYKTRADNYATARNVAIGVTGALVVWSVIDAVVTPGVTRIKIRKGEQLQIRPTALLMQKGMGFGASLSYIF